MHCGTAVREHLACLPPMKFLTALRVLSANPFLPLSERPSSRFLEGLPRLQQLILQDVLDEERWDDAVVYIAALLQLTELRLLSTLSVQDRCWNLSNDQLRPSTQLIRLEVFEAEWPWL